MRILSQKTSFLKKTSIFSKIVVSKKHIFVEESLQEQKKVVSKNNKKSTYTLIFLVRFYYSGFVCFIEN